VSPPVRVRSLWQVTQYVVSTAAWGDGDPGAAGGAASCAAPVGPAASATSTVPDASRNALTDNASLGGKDRGRPPILTGKYKPVTRI
jgi:hypothetical protein